MRVQGLSPPSQHPLHDKHLAQFVCQVNQVVSTLPELGTFAYLIVLDRFLSESDIFSTLGLLKNLVPDLDSSFSYHSFNKALKHTFIGPLTPLVRDSNILVV